MRRRYLIGYDVSDPKRLRRMHKTMRGFGDALQYSIFLCDLTDAERTLMLEKVSGVMHERDDRVFVVDLGAIRKADRIQFLGKRPELTGVASAVIV